MRRLLTAIVLIVAITAAEAQTFTRITSAGPLVTDEFLSIGASWADFNNDGWIDVFVAETEHASFLYQNNGDGTFASVTDGAIVEQEGVYNLGIWGDYDNDGDLDVYVTNWATIVNGGPGTPLPNYLYRNDGPPTYTFSATDGPMATDLNITYSSSWVDYDNDGDLDLSVPGTSGSSDLFYRNDGESGFTRLDTLPFLQAGDWSTHDAWVDYDGDGDQDLLMVNTGSPNFLFRNTLAETGSPDFEEVSPNEAGGAIPDVPGAWTWGASWGDYDNDGDFDLFLSSLNSPNRFYQVHEGQFSAVAGTPLDEPGCTQADVCSYGGSWGDFDNDGDLDLFVANFGRFSYYYRNDGDGAFTKLMSEEVGDLLGETTYASAGPTVADYDNDGDLDIFVTNADFSQVPAGPPVPKANFLFQNNATDELTNHWLSIHLEGTVSNRSAYGAVVRVRATISGETVWLTRRVSGSPTDGVAQSDTRLHFGLGDAATVETLEIRWPSGEVETLSNVSVDQFLQLREGSITGQQGTAPEAPAGFGLRQSEPNPFSHTTAITFDLDATAAIELAVYDALGRKVRTLAEGPYAVGTHTVVWDGRDGQGATVASGSYVYVLSSGGTTTHAQGVFVR